jgi:hypothetical protein
VDAGIVDLIDAGIVKPCVPMAFVNEERNRR